MRVRYLLLLLLLGVLALHEGHRGIHAGPENPYLEPLTLLIGVNSENVAAVVELEPHIRARDILVVEVGHVADSPWDEGEVYGLVARLNDAFPNNRIFLVARPHHLPIELPPRVTSVLIDHERSSYGDWSNEWGWNQERTDWLESIQSGAGLVSPPPTDNRREGGWNWGVLSQGMTWHNVMVQAACRDGNRTDGDTSRWDERAGYLASQHESAEFLSMQVTMKRDADQYTDPWRVLECLEAARLNGVPNVLIFGGHPDDLRVVLTEQRVAR